MPPNFNGKTPKSGEKTTKFCDSMMSKRCAPKFHAIPHKNHVKRTEVNPSYEHVSAQRCAPKYRTILLRNHVKRMKLKHDGASRSISS